MMQQRFSLFPATDRRASSRGLSARRNCAGNNLFLLMATVMAWTVAPISSLLAQNPLVINDPDDDAIIRRTDPGNDDLIDPQTQRLPDIVTIHLGRFSPDVPKKDLFSGAWNVAGGFLRFDIVFKGLVNPPGPVNWDDDWPSYAPLLFGPNPVTGYIEFDLDADENTGGELENPKYRYLGNVARFGGIPAEPRFWGRVAIDRTAFDWDFLNGPSCDRSGEEFHLVLRAEEIDEIKVKYECSGGNPGQFDAGERWILEGDFFHRAHGFEDFAFQCEDRPGRYKPEVELQFQHDLLTDQTTISLVYPLTNAACASTHGSNTQTQSNDGCDDNQNSITEALTDLTWSTIHSEPWVQLQPEFQLISGWGAKSASSFLNPSQWRVSALIGTPSATPQSSNDRYIWTDIWPNVVLGDYDGDGVADALDAVLLNDYIVIADGDPDCDDDGINGIIQVHNFARSAILYDANYDGFVNQDDLPSSVLPGDMDLNGLVDFDDVDDFALALVDPAGYADSHNGQDPLAPGDLNQDNTLDALDIQEFITVLHVIAP